MLIPFPRSHVSYLSHDWDQILLEISFRGMILQIKTCQHYTIFYNSPTSSGELLLLLIHSVFLILKNKLSWEHFNSAYCEEGQVLAWALKEEK